MKGHPQGQVRESFVQGRRKDVLCGAGSSRAEGRAVQALITPGEHTTAQRASPHTVGVVAATPWEVEWTGGCQFGWGLTGN